MKRCTAWILMSIAIAPSLSAMEGAWSVEGRVTDAEGRGLADVTVGASCGWGSLEKI